MANIIAITNQKGGVGKTTSAINLGAELAFKGNRVLLVDFDPQGNATSGIGTKLPEGENTADLYDMFFGNCSLKDIICESTVPDLFVAPSSSDLISIETELGKQPGRELILRSEINRLKERFDYVLIDCPPSSGLLTLNALGAAPMVLIPVQAEYYALEGLSSLLKTIEFVQQTFNPELQILGVFLTMYDGRTRLSAQVEDEVRGYFGKLKFKSRIPRSVRISESPSHGLPVALYDPGSTGTKAYRSLAGELRKRCEGEQKKIANA